MLRLARGALRHPSASRGAERLAIASGRALHRARANRLAVPAFSLVWDLEYHRSLAEASGVPLQADGGHQAQHRGDAERVEGRKGQADQQEREQRGLAADA